MRGGEEQARDHKDRVEVGVLRGGGGLLVTAAWWHSLMPASRPCRRHGACKALTDAWSHSLIAYQELDGATDAGVTAPVRHSLIAPVRHSLIAPVRHSLIAPVRRH